MAGEAEADVPGMYGGTLRHRGTRIFGACLGAPLLVLCVALTAHAAFASVRTITRSDATSIATAISLRHSDLPTMAQHSNPVTPQEQRLNAQATSCAGGVPPSEAYADTQSPSFVSTGQASVTVASGVEILPSASLVAKDFAAIERPDALRCLTSEFTSALSPSLPKGDKVTNATASRLPSVVATTGETFEIRLTFDISFREGTSTVSVPVYTDQIGFADGQAEVTLEVQTTSVKPSTSLEHQLAGLLLARARTAIG
jgi:hypothetical protein